MQRWEGTCRLHLHACLGSNFFSGQLRPGLKWDRLYCERAIFSPLLTVQNCDKSSNEEVNPGTSGHDQRGCRSASTTIIRLYPTARVLFKKKKNQFVWVRVCVRARVSFEICASLLCLSSKGFSPDNVMSGCVSSTNPSLDSNISSQSETPSSLCCVPSFHIQQH